MAVEDVDRLTDQSEQTGQQQDNQQRLPKQSAVDAAVEAEEIPGPVHTKGSGRPENAAHPVR